VAEAIKVFISYSHDSPEHMDRVLAFSERLPGDRVEPYRLVYGIERLMVGAMWKAL
jgi:hypothetical protein